MPSRAALSSMAWPSAMSESDRPRCQNRMVSSSRSRPGLRPGDDLADLGVQRRLRELARLDVRAQRAELAGFALAPIVDDHLGHDVGERELDRAHRAVGHDQRARLDPCGLQHRRRLGEPRGLDDDVGALDAGAPVLRSPSPACRDRARGARRRRRGFPAGANARGSRRSRTDGRAGARSSRRCRARRHGRAPSSPCARDASRRSPSPRRCACR